MSLPSGEPRAVGILDRFVRLTRPVGSGEKWIQ
jgi:hypothetical protein